MPGELYRQHFCIHLVFKKSSTSLLDADSYLRSFLMSIISDAIQKHHELRTQRFKSYQQDPTERQAYLAYCQKEAKRIFDSLLKEILDDIVRYGKAFVHVVGKYDN